ncbi:MAG: cation-translocating P-type ATPase [Clostridia bacterium]|nr:cation-translocating P-type ATPase [Clostridia bacterium]
MKKLKNSIEALESVPATVVGGVCLAVSLVLSLCGVVVPLYLEPSWVAVAVCGVPLLYSALRKLFCNKGVSRISSALLISIAMGASIAIGDLFAAGEIAFIMAIGELLEERTTERAKKGLTQLISLTPQTARRLTASGEEMVSAAAVRVGDVLRVLPGETVPTDGEIVAGETSIDQSVMTGESLPVDKAAGDAVYGGTVNRYGAVDIRTTKVGEDSSLQRLIRMVKEAEENKAPMQRTADRWASRLVPVALLLAVVAGLLRQDIVAAVTVLVVFCPCALVLATPTAIMAAIGQATGHGILIKSGEALEQMGQVDTVAFDKTGTLTTGQLNLTDTVSFGNITEQALLRLAAAVESRSEHPLGQAIVTAAKGAELSLPEAEDFRMAAGRGVCARVGGALVLCGSDAYLEEAQVPLQVAEATLSALREQGKATVLVAADGELLGVLALADTLRPAAAHLAKQLSEAGVETVLLTGDNRHAAAYFAAQAGLTRVEAELLPADKVARIAALQAEGKRVCMMGDGVNDAPALKAADVGVAMGTMGSDIAVEAADVALMGDDIAKLPYLKRLATATLRTIRLGIALSLAINFIAIALSFFGVLTPTTGALVHNAGSVLVVLIAARLYDRKFEN